MADLGSMGWSRYREETDSSAFAILMVCIRVKV